VVEGPAFAYRHRARLSVRRRSASPKIGLFQAGSHRIVDIPHCPIHHPLINRSAAAVKRAVRESGVAPYAERPHRGDLRGIQVVVERASQTVQVVLIGNSTDSGSLADPAAKIVSELGDRLHSLWWNGNPERTNTVLGPHWKLLQGPAAVSETIAGARVCFPPGAFGQSNLDLADQIVERIGTWVPPGARIAEFYAGCGAIGLGLLPGCRRLVFNEVAADSLAGLELGLRECAERDRAQVCPGTAGEHAELVRDAEVVIADPPRKGLAAPLIEALTDTPPSTLIYLSCGLDSFLRDCARLCDSHRLRLSSLEVYALFPHTDHVETLARFSRAD